MAQPLVPDSGPPPLIIIGMHRSGTTLVAELLGKFGVNWGRVRDNYNESVCFQVLNEQLFAVHNCRWDNPECLDRLFAGEVQLNRGMDIGRAIVDAEWLRLGYGDRVADGRPFAGWGFKDPKSTFTLPVLLKLFPGAKVLHVLRNGIDVAISLQKREASRPEGVDHPHYSRRCQSLEGCFELWKCYVKRALAYDQNGVDIRLLYYEDLLEDPENAMLRLTHWFGLEPGMAQADSVARIDRSRRYGFKHNTIIRDFAAKAAMEPLLIQLYREKRDFWSTS